MAITSNKAGMSALAAMVALALSACGDGDGAGDDQPGATAETDSAGADDDSADAQGADIVIDGEEYDFSYSCGQPSDMAHQLVVSGMGLSGEDFYTSFDAEGTTLVGVDHADDYWEAGGTGGEIRSLELDPDAGYARGEATFENEAGDTLEGTFNSDCP